MCRPVRGKEFFGAFADVRTRSYARYGFGEAVRQDGVVEDDGRSRCTQRFDRVHECSACLRTQRLSRCVAVRCGLRWSLRGRTPLEGNASALKNEGRNAEAFATERIALQIFRVRSWLRLLRRADSCRVRGIFASHHGECDRRIGDISRDGTGVVEQPIQWSDACDAHESTSGKDADHGAGSGGHADGVAGIGAVAEKGEVGGDGRHRAARRTAGTEAHVVGVAGASVCGAAVGVARGKVRHVGFAQDDGSCSAQFRDDGGIARRCELVSGKDIAFPSIARDEATDAGVFLDNNGNAPHGAAMEGGAPGAGFRVFLRRGCQCSRFIDILKCAVDAVVSPDAIQVPVHDLGDGVLVIAVEGFELRNADFEQIAIHCCLRICSRGRDWTRMDSLRRGQQENGNGDCLFSQDHCGCALPTRPGGRLRPNVFIMSPADRSSILLRTQNTSDGVSEA